MYRRPGCVDDSAVPGIGTWADAAVAVSTSGGDASFRVALAHGIAMRVAGGTSLRSAAKEALVAMRALASEATAGVVLVGPKSWAALQLGPTMPVAWFDDSGPGDDIGFAL